VSWAIWITGPPGSGKTTLARSVTAALHTRGICVEVLELDEIRKVLTPAPSYTDLERDVVYRALAYMAMLLTRAGIPVIVDATGHRRAWRDLARTLIPVFGEIQLVCPFEVCREREATRHAGHAPTGIYAHSGQPGATVPGVDVPYEEAVKPDLVLETHRSNLGTAVQEVVYVARRLQRHAAWLEARTRRRPLCV
jgi:adenylylsulfate kinase